MNDLVIPRIAADVERSSAPHGMTTRIVAVDGGGGAGKTSFATLIAEALGGVQVVHTDDFASWDDPHDWWPRLVAEVLEPLARNEPSSFVTTQWHPDHSPRRIDVRPADFLVLEGVTACRAAFRPFLAYTIWVETPADLRLRRGLERDGEEARPQWEEWMRAEDDYRRRERPDLHADAVIAGDGPRGAFRSTD